MRDTGVLREYGFPVFSISTTPRQGPHVHQPWSCNTVINCGGVVVRPGDAIVGDDDHLKAFDDKLQGATSCDRGGSFGARPLIRRNWGSAVNKGLRMPNSSWTFEVLR